MIKSYYFALALQSSFIFKWWSDQTLKMFRIFNGLKTLFCNSEFYGKTRFLIGGYFEIILPQN
ncbi:hypothetical protein AA974_04135 [Helicobacter pylori]|nr:hypothetical protein AA974_04135 [Helicobacter pylori]